MQVCIKGLLSSTFTMYTVDLPHSFARPIPSGLIPTSATATCSWRLPIWLGEISSWLPPTEHGSIIKEAWRALAKFIDQMKERIISGEPSPSACVCLDGQKVATTHACVIYGRATINRLYRTILCTRRSSALIRPALNDPLHSLILYTHRSSVLIRSAYSINHNTQ